MVIRREDLMLCGEDGGLVLDTVQDEEGGLYLAMATMNNGINGHLKEAILIKLVLITMKGRHTCHPQSFVLKGNGD
jgi:hypothetical protein